jgi:hypothetical protein
MTTARTALRYESAMWRGLFRWLTRRPDVPAGAAGFGNAKAKAPVLITFIALCALETVAFHLLLPWPAVRIPVDVISVYGLLWMMGLLGGTWSRPHVVGPDGVHLRDGLVLEILVPWDAIETARHGTRTLNGGRGVHIERSVASVAVLGQTNVDLVLRRPVPVPVRGGGTEPVDEIRCYADDPAGLAGRVQARRGEVDRRAGAEHPHP